MAMNKITVFDALFPQDLLVIAKKIIKMKNGYDGKIPKILENNTFVRFNKTNIYYNQAKSILLYYKKSAGSQSKRLQIFNDLIAYNKLFPSSELIFGYLQNVSGNGVTSSATDENETITWKTKDIKIMCGERLLRFLLGEAYDTIIENSR